MLAPKSMPLKKIALYAVILILLSGGTVFTLYNNLYVNKRASGQNEEEQKIQNAARVPEGFGAGAGNAPKADIQGELDFLASEKFKKLRSNLEISEITAAGNNNPFMSSGQNNQRH